ncbi:TadE/TadG family type IV pilus assembly protein [Henriciella litoralis]|uniref:TadE/TadG family type IV pilus assembly protein n=1 Tax=Henriciella litoralis TaxID=568102 RepID=UPI000A0370CA|nr:TadE/TadG family type IV pilus assembly protein [Henriciella litoralis]
MWTRIARFGADERGASAMIFALIAVAVLALAGVAIDLQRGFSADARLQSAIDASALAGAKSLEDSSLSDADIKLAVQNAFAANIDAGPDALDCDAPGVLIDRTNGTVRVNANCDLPTTIASLTKVDKVSMSNESSARAAMTKLDVALMLDVSGSMKGEKLEDLKVAASDAIDILITQRTGDRVRVGFNAYSDSVNAGSYADAVMDRPRWARPTVCVSERKGAAAWKDDAPGNNKWIGSAASSCPSTPVEPLSSNASVLKGKIDKLRANGSTAGHIGVAWAWYLISPAWKDIWPAASAPRAYDEPQSKKAVILMTDGEFNTEYERWQGNSKQQAKKLCGRMRDEGILVYAIAFDVRSSAKRVLEDCAGEKSRFFDAKNGDELKSAYRSIASQLTNLALTE